MTRKAREIMVCAAGGFQQSDATKITAPSKRLKARKLHLNP
jgi:hypothetical protein